MLKGRIFLFASDGFEQNETEMTLNPISSLDQEAELSYAYLHAVASAAGASCSIGSRLEDGRGIDAKLTVWRDFGPKNLREVDVNVQLKATIAEKKVTADGISYFVKGRDRYDDLRSTQVGTQKILVVLFLPKDQADWLKVSKDALVLQNCAYWVSLRGATASKNTTGQTVYLPEKNIFNPKGLIEIAQVLSGQKYLDYANA